MVQSSLTDAGFMDALTPLTVAERASFANWQNALQIPFGTIHLFEGIPFQVLDYKNRQFRDFLGGQDNDLTAELTRYLARLRDWAPESATLAGDSLLLNFPEREHAGSGQIAILTPALMARFVTVCYPQVRIPPALLRLLTCYLGGLTLSESARRDSRSIDTRKRQAQELRRRLGLDRESSIVRVVGARLHVEIHSLLNWAGVRDHRAFLTHIRHYMPSQIRPLILHDAEGQPIRVLDMGPIDGTPVIALHPMILPDFRPVDLELLAHLRLRLLWPLRNGLYAPNDPALDAEAHLAHALAGIERLRQHFVPGPVSLLSFAASSKVALAYAAAFPACVRHLIFAAACVLEQRPTGGPRRLARGMVALSRHHPVAMRATALYMTQVLLSEQRFPEFIRNRFRDCPADSRLIAEELHSDDRGERIRQALQLSLGSVLQDYVFQSDLGWDRAAGTAQEMHFLHGEDDRIHPLPLIESLAYKLGAPPPRMLPGAGQMLHGPHFRGLAEHLALLTAHD